MSPRLDNSRTGSGLTLSLTLTQRIWLLYMNGCCLLRVICVKRKYQRYHKSDAWCCRWNRSCWSAMVCDVSRVRKHWINERRYNMCVSGVISVATTNGTVRHFRRCMTLVLCRYSVWLWAITDLSQDHGFEPFSFDGTVQCHERLDRDISSEC